MACLGTVDDLGPRLWLEAVRGGIATAQQVVWISDGARGFWRLFQTYLMLLATIWLDGRTQKARGWFAATIH